MTDDSVVGYLARGWSVVALHSVVQGVCTCGTPGCPNPGKHPLYKNWQRIPIRDQGVWQHVSARPLPTNVGIATGRSSGVFALDFDPKNVIDSRAVLDVIDALPPTWSQQTGSGGRHWLFLMPADFEPTNSTGRLPKGLDIRGTGGQIVASPSITDKGAYVVLTDVPAAPPPQLLLDLIRPPAYTPRPPTAPGPVTDARGAAYAERAREGLLIDLRNEHATRNEQAYRVACRLHELLNAGWLDYDITYDAYLEACEQASANKPGDPFPQAEADRVWQNAAHKTQDKTAELPPSSLGATPLDFPAARADDGFSLDLPFGPSTDQTAPPAAEASLNLPPEFWAARVGLKHIQLAAHSRLVSADVALYSMLARLAALWPHEVRINNGVKNGASANLFVSVVGPSGSGKTSGIGVARGLLSRPPWLDVSAFADDRPLGTGEGIAESYMGSKSVRKLDEFGVPLQDKTGAFKLEKVRGQILHNALVHADEGEAMAKLLERSGATVAETLRRAWVGETLGQSNGSAETTRIIREGRYSLGMIIGFQPETAQPVLNDIAPGTPQRFLWCWALDPSIPEEDVPDPGPVRDVWPASGDDGNAWIIGAVGGDLRPVTFDQAITDELKPLLRGVSKGTLILPPLEAHFPLMLVKVATLLAYLDGGRRHVDTSDWALAKTIWATSRRVQDHLMAYGRELLGKASAAKRAAHAAQEVEADQAKTVARDERQAASEERVAIQMARALQTGGATLTLSGLKHKSAPRDRALAAQAVSVVLERQWAVLTDDGRYAPGPVRL